MKTEKIKPSSEKLPVVDFWLDIEIPYLRGPKCWSLKNIVANK